jgi:hypothetical protein
MPEDETSLAWKGNMYDPATTISFSQVRFYTHVAEAVAVSLAVHLHRESHLVYYDVTHEGV